MRTILIAGAVAVALALTSAADASECPGRLGRVLGPAASATGQVGPSPGFAQAMAEHRELINRLRQEGLVHDIGTPGGGHR